MYTNSLSDSERGYGLILLQPTITRSIRNIQPTLPRKSNTASIDLLSEMPRLDVWNSKQIESHAHQSQKALNLFYPRLFRFEETRNGKADCS